MKVLVVKLTSMGDAIHLLPALSDLQAQQPDVSIDWMIEESFTEIPTWHSSVDKTIAVATRRWRANKLAAGGEFLRFWRELRGTHYDVIIDAQGLIKSAVFARCAKLAAGGRRIGFSASSIKEKPAAKFYQQKIEVPRQQHAISRLRQLFARAFNYSVDDTQLDYQQRPYTAKQSKCLMFLHGTTWPSKHLPESVWHELIELAHQSSYQILLPWGNQIEKDRAERFAAANSNAKVLAKSSLDELKAQMMGVDGAIAVDTGLGHLAAALGVPTVSIYGSTDAKLTGTAGDNQQQLQADYTCSPCLLKQCDKITDGASPPPCYASLSATNIWTTLVAKIT